MARRYPRVPGSPAAKAQSRAAFAAAGGFFPILDAALGALIESNIVTLTNVGSAVPLTISGGSYSKNGGAYSTTATTVSDGDTLRIRVTAPSTNSATATATISLNSITRSFSVTTAAPSTGTPTPTPTPTPTLNPLVLSGSLIPGAASTGTISNATDGSTITSTGIVGLVVNSAARTYAFNGSAAAGAVGKLTESLSGVTLDTSISVSAVGSVAALPTTAAFDGVDPYVDLNDGGSYKVGGTTYQTIAAMVTAGIYTQITPGATTMQNGDQLLFPAALPSPYTVRAEGTTGPAVAANGVAQTMVSLEDPGSVITDEIFQLRRQYTSTGATNRASILAYKGSASQANYQDLNGTLNGLSQPVVIVGSAAPNSYQLAYGARDASRQTTTATVSTGLTRMVIGNQSDGTRSWTGSVKRVTIWLSVFVPTQMTALSAYPFSGAVYGAHTGNEQPFSQQYGNKVYVGQSRSGFQSLAEIDVDTKVMTDLINVGSAYAGNDDHRSPVMLKTPTGKFFTVYTGHGDDNIIRYRRSTDGSPRNLGAEQQISTSGIGSAAYSMVHIHAATGAMYIIVRSSLLRWVFSVSTDDGVTFSAPKVLTTHPSKQSYIYGEWATTNRLRFFANENAALEATLRIFEWDVVTGNIYAANNTIVGNSETGGVNFDDMTIFRPYTADRSSQIMCFGNDATSIMYGQLNDRDELSRQVVAKLTTGADPFVPANWVTTAITPEYTGASDQRRFNGQGTFSYRTDLAMPRAFVCVRIGTNWVLQQIDFTAADLSTFTTTNLRSVPDTDYNAILRPRSPKGSDGRLDVSWQEGLYPNYQTWDATKVNRRWAA